MDGRTKGNWRAIRRSVGVALVFLALVALGPVVVRVQAAEKLLDIRTVAAKTLPPPKSAKPVAAPAPALSLTARYVGRLRDKAPCVTATLNVVAHQDDDLLFLNPDISSDIAAGRCVRTVYLTAGDAGLPAAYWQGRETGVKTAYADMAGVPDEWQDDRALLDGRFVSVSYLRERPNLSLIFLRLPDGNIRGDGFAASGYQSLAQLVAGTITEMRTVDDKSPYSLAQLTDLLNLLAALDKPAVVRALNPDNPADGDHSDHHAAGQLARMATVKTVSPVSVTYYLGYPIARLPANLSESDSSRKQRTFLRYSKSDGAVCHSREECLLTTSFGSYFAREYTVQPPTVSVAAVP